MHLGTCARLNSVSPRPCLATTIYIHQRTSERALIWKESWQVSLVKMRSCWTRVGPHKEA